VTLLWAILLTAAVTGAAVTAMLLVRRRAPEGSFFEDGDRAAGVFGVLATGFSVLLGFMVFLAFENYDNSRSGAEAEAVAVAQQFETAQTLPPRVSKALSGELVCYARYVVGRSWPRMENGTLGNEINPWGVRLFRTLKTARPSTPTQQSAYDKWLDQTSDREQARYDRIHGAQGVVPDPLWIVLFFTATVIFTFVLFFADSGERTVVQGFLMGSVVGVMTATLLLIASLDRPYHRGVGSLRPVAMERALEILAEEQRVVGRTIRPPCDADGAPKS
jgi:hypothetical protein